MVRLVCATRRDSIAKGGGVLPLYPRRVSIPETGYDQGEALSNTPFAMREVSTRLHFAIIGSRGYPSFYGGFETLVRHLAPFLRDAGDEVTVYDRRHSWHPSHSSIDGISVIRTAGLDRQETSTLSFGWSACRHAERQRYDAALLLNVANGFFLKRLIRSGLPAAVNVDGVEWERAKWNWLARSVFLAGARRCATYATRLVADSEAIADIWEETFDRRPIYIPYGAAVPTSTGFERLRDLGLEHGSYVLIVARLVPENNVELALEACARLARPRRVVVVGAASRRNSTEKRLSHLMADHTSNVTWLGHIDDQTLLSQLWAGAALYVHGHSAGGTNPALLQALASGCPTLALDTAFNREVIGDEEQLYPANSAGLAAKMEGFFSDATASDRYAARGLAVVRSRYLWPQVCLEYREVLMELASRGGR